MNKKKTLDDIKEVYHTNMPYHKLSKEEITILLIIINAEASTSDSKKDARWILENYKTKTRWGNMLW